MADIAACLEVVHMIGKKNKGMPMQVGKDEPRVEGIVSVLEGTARKVDPGMISELGKNAASVRRIAFEGREGSDWFSG